MTLKKGNFKFTGKVTGKSKCSSHLKWLFNLSQCCYQIFEGYSLDPNQDDQMIMTEISEHDQKVDNDKC